MKYAYLVLFILAACADDNVRHCDSKLASDFSLKEIQGLPTTLGSFDITLRGVLDRPKYVTIYSVVIAGLDATDEGGNFTQFSVTVPVAVQERLKSDLKLPVTVLTNCGPISLPSIEVTPAPLGPKSTTLSIAVDDALTEHGYLPLAPIHPLLVTVEGDADANGVAIELTTSLGTLLHSMLVLRSVPMTTHTSASTYLLPPDKAGRAVLVARSGGTSAFNTDVVFLGPPRLSPPDGLIYVGTTAVVSIDTPSIDDTASKIGSCNIIAPPGVTVTGPNTNNNIQIVVGPTSMDEHVLEITCRDVFGQAISGNYTVMP